MAHEEYCTREITHTYRHTQTGLHAQTLMGLQEVGSFVSNIEVILFLALFRRIFVAIQSTNKIFPSKSRSTVGLSGQWVVHECSYIWARLLCLSCTWSTLCHTFASTAVSHLSRRLLLFFKLNPNSLASCGNLCLKSTGRNTVGFTLATPRSWPHIKFVFVPSYISSRDCFIKQAIVSDHWTSHYTTPQSHHIMSTHALLPSGLTLVPESWS